jgi:hypothetical protein
MSESIAAPFSTALVRLAIFPSSTPRSRWSAATLRSAFSGVSWVVRHASASNQVARAQPACRCADRHGKHGLEESPEA